MPFVITSPEITVVIFKIAIAVNGTAGLNEEVDNAVNLHPSVMEMINQKLVRVDLQSSREIIHA